MLCSFLRILFGLNGCVRLCSVIEVFAVVWCYSLSVNKKAGGASKPKKTSKKAVKDPNKPKRPASAFFVFM